MRNPTIDRHRVMELGRRSRELVQEMMSYGITDTFGIDVSFTDEAGVHRWRLLIKPVKRPWYSSLLKLFKR